MGSHDGTTLAFGNVRQAALLLAAGALVRAEAVLILAAFVWNTRHPHFCVVAERFPIQRLSKRLHVIIYLSTGTGECVGRKILPAVEATIALLFRRCI